MTIGTDRLKAERSAVLRLPIHPNAARTESFRRWVARQRRPLAIDLFSGCGGLSIGLEQAGYTVVLSVDNDPWALETHRHNLPGAAIDLDLSNPERVEVLLRLLDGFPIDLVAGGPPCQPFSRAGRSKLRDLVRGGVRSAKDDRTELWQSLVSIVERLRPAAMMLENVPDMALGDDVAIPRAITQRLEKVGYDVQMRLVDSWRLGVPQHRQRLILVALRDGQQFTWPAEQKKITLREAIGGFGGLVCGTGCMRQRLPDGRTSFFPVHASLFLSMGASGTAALITMSAREARAISGPVSYSRTSDGMVHRRNDSSLSAGGFAGSGNTKFSRHQIEPSSGFYPRY